MAPRRVGARGRARRRHLRHRAQGRRRYLRGRRRGGRGRRRHRRRLHPVLGGDRPRLLLGGRGHLRRHGRPGTRRRSGRHAHAHPLALRRARAPPPDGGPGGRERSAPSVSTRSWASGRWGCCGSTSASSTGCGATRSSWSCSPRTSCGRRRPPRPASYCSAPATGISYSVRKRVRAANSVSSWLWSRPGYRCSM